MDYARLGALLREGRRSSSLTQGDVANVLGVSFQNVSHWELGKIKIDIDSFIRLCEIYGLDVAETLHTASERSEKDATVPGKSRCSAPTGSWTERDGGWWTRWWRTSCCAFRRTRAIRPTWESRLQPGEAA